ncbi:MAG: BON domain-containing protein [Planctomycetota bacterium]
MSISKTTFLLAALASTCLMSAGRAEDLAATVAGSLRDSGALSGYRVNVKSKSGTVWLEGRVADEKQLAAAVGIAETTPGVERVVNRLVIDSATRPQPAPTAFAMPSSAWGAAGVSQPAAEPAAEPAVKPAKPNPLAMLTGGFLFAGGSAGEQQEGGVQLVRGTAPAPQPRGQRPLPLGTPTGRPVNPQAYANSRTAMRTSMQEPMTLPAPGGYDCQVGDGQIVPGTMRYSEGGPVGGGPGGGPGGGMPGGMQGGMAGGPMAMGGTGVGMPPVPMRGDGPNMPNYAWPSYAAYPNYAALQYPTQYSPTAWPYIGPFYPYPQVPLGWRRVSLEWDDGWWWLDFDERHHHSHHH